MRVFFAAFGLFVCALYQANGQVPATVNPASSSTEIGLVEHLNETIPAGLMFTGTDGKKYDLKKLIDKPTLLTFVYYRCPGLCSPLMNNVADLISKSDLTMGKDYQVLTISFNPEENTGLAIKKRDNYLKQIKKTVDQSSWKFFTGDSATIAQITELTGFKYKRTGNDFLHPAVLIILSPDGKITRYLEGTYFLPFEFKMAIVEATEGKSGPTIYRLLQYCYSYDPAGRQYVLNITKLAGTFILFTGAVVFLILVFKPKKKLTSNNEL